MQYWYWHKNPTHSFGILSVGWWICTSRSMKMSNFSRDRNRWSIRGLRELIQKPVWHLQVDHILVHLDVGGGLDSRSLSTGHIAYYRGTCPRSRVLPQSSTSATKSADLPSPSHRFYNPGIVVQGSVSQKQGWQALDSPSSRHALPIYQCTVYISAHSIKAFEYSARTITAYSNP